MDAQERNRLERKLKKAKRSADDLRDEVARTGDNEERRRLSSEIDDLETKAKRLKRKLR